MKSLMAMVVFIVAACGPAVTDSKIGDSAFREEHITLTDGRVITCVRFWTTGAISCDWSGS